MFSKKLFIFITSIFIILSTVYCDKHEDNLRNQRRIVGINQQEEIPPHIVQLEQQQQQLQEAPQEAIIFHIVIPLGEEQPQGFPLGEGQPQGFPLGGGLPQGFPLGGGLPQGLPESVLVNMVTNFLNAQIQHAQQQPQEEFEEID